MRLAFLSSFVIDNKSGQDIWVSPIGAVGKDGARHPLPFYNLKYLAIRSPKRAEFYIAKDTSRAFIYDWDDIQFSEILIRPKQGDIRFIVVDPNPTSNQYRKLKGNRFTIGSLSDLPAATDNPAIALSSIGKACYWRVYALPGLGLIGPILAIILWRTRNKGKIGIIR